MTALAVFAGCSALVAAGATVVGAGLLLDSTSILALDRVRLVTGELVPSWSA